MELQAINTLPVIRHRFRAMPCSLVITLIFILSEVQFARAQFLSDVRQSTPCYDTVIHASHEPQSSVKLLTPSSLTVQLVAGGISYAIPFWTLVYPRLQHGDRQFTNSPDIVAVLGFGIAVAAVPVGMDLGLGALHWRRGNLGMGIVGSLLGAFIPRLLIQSDDSYRVVLFSGIGSVLGSMLFYNLFAASNSEQYDATRSYDR